MVSCVSERNAASERKDVVGMLDPTTTTKVCDASFDFAVPAVDDVHTHTHTLTREYTNCGLFQKKTLHHPFGGREREREGKMMQNVNRQSE